MPELAQSATPERLAKLPEGGVEAIVQDGTTETIQRVIAAPLDRERKRGRITAREYEAGDQCRRDAFASKIDPAAPTVDWNALGGHFGPRVPSAFTAQAVMDARRRYRAVERGLNGFSWAVLRITVVDEEELEEVGHGLLAYKSDRDARAAGFGAFRVALGELALFYERVK